MRRLTVTLCLTLAVLLGVTGVSASTEKKPFWALSEILADHPDPSLKDDQFVKRVKIKISFSGLKGSFSAMGWVNLNFGECHGFMVVNGDLTVYNGDSEVGALLPVVNLPLGKTVYQKGSDQLAVLPLNQQTAFSDDERSPIRWVDIDGDSEEELIYSSVCGNRFATHHYIFEYDTLPIGAKFSNPIEVRHFNPDKFPQTVITTDWSSSSCGVVQETFKSIAGKYILRKLSITDYISGECVSEDFKRRDDGRLCLTRRSIGLNEIQWSDHVVGTQKSNETCHAPPKY